MEKISIIMLTLGRYHITRDSLEHNLKFIGCGYELLIADNGSDDKELIAWLRTLGARVLILNNENKGVAPMQNELMRHSTGTHICFFGNDIKLPADWGRKLIEAHNKLPYAGLVGVFCVGDKGEVVEFNGIKAHTQWNCFGTCLMSRAVFEKVGYLCNRYAPYGLEDSDYHFRLNCSGFKNYYLYGESCEHVGDDVQDKTPYRKMKWDSLHKNQVIYGEQTEIYKATSNYYVPFNQ